MAQMAYGSRIRQARELRGMTQKELAAHVGVNQSAIAQIEKERYTPSSDLLKAIATETGFLPSFFEQEPIDSFPLGSLSYRSKRALTAREETAAYQHAKISFEQVKKMASHLEIPHPRLPRTTEKPSVAAKLTRVSFGLSPAVPIKNLMHTIERNGVLIFTLPLILPNIDAFSSWAELDLERPLIAISSGKPMDRLRFSIAHELGHLVMHQAIKGSLKTVEKEAYEFAAEFLLPEVAMKQELLPPVTLTSVAKLKVLWGVSMQSLIYRARELRIITERQAKYLFAQMATHGWKTREPSNLDIKLETPQVVRTMMESLYESPEQYALDMGLSLKTATEFYVYT